MVNNCTLHLCRRLLGNGYRTLQENSCHRRKRPVYYLKKSKTKYFSTKVTMVGNK